MTDFRKPTLKEVIRAQVAYLFSRYRPVGGQTDDEQKAVGAERVEFVDRLHSYLKALEAPEEAIIQEVRNVAREVYAEPPGARLPTPESIANRVKGVFQGRAPNPDCAGCKVMSGYYLRNGEDEPLIPPHLGPRVPWPKGLHLCIEHHLAANFYAWREAWHQRGKAFNYPPPQSLMPRSWRPSDTGNVTPWTDGDMMGPMARWARQHVMEVYDFSLPIVVTEQEPMLALPEPPAATEALPEV